MKIEFTPPMDLVTFGKALRKLAKSKPGLTVKQALPDIRKIAAKNNAAKK